MKNFTPILYISWNSLNGFSISSKTNRQGFVVLGGRYSVKEKELYNINERKYFVSMYSINLVLLLEYMCSCYLKNFIVIVSF